MARKYKQSKASRLDESLGERRGKESTKSQSLASRRHESEGMERHFGRSPFEAVRTVARQQEHEKQLKAHADEGERHRMVAGKHMRRI